MCEDGTWGGNQELYAAARLFQVYVVVHQDQPSARIMLIECDRLKPTRIAHVAYHGEDHYDSVRSLRDPIDPDSLPVSIELNCEGFRPEDLAKVREFVRFLGEFSQSRLRLPMRLAVDFGSQRWQTQASPGPGAAGKEHQPEQRVVPSIVDGEVDQLAGTLGEQLQLSTAAGKTLSKREQRQLKRPRRLRSTTALGVEIIGTP